MGRGTYLGRIAAVALAAIAVGAAAAAAGVLQRPERLEAYGGYGYQPPSRPEHPWIVFADREGMPLFADPELRRRSGSARFMQRFYVAGESGDRKALRLVDGRLRQNLAEFVVEKDYGWAPVEQLLVSQVAIQDFATRIFDKAVVVTDYSIVADAADSRKLRRDQAVLHESPDSGSGVARPVGLQDFGYVFKKVTDSGGHNWYLIGPEPAEYGPTWSEERQAKEKKYGWLIDERSHLWASREAFEPAPDRTEPVHIYANSPDLLEDRQDRILFRDTLSRKPWEPARFRYPHDRTGFFPRGSYPGVDCDVAEIGFLSRLSYFDGQGGGGNLDPEQVARLKQGAEALWARLQALDIVFVIDATESMRPHLRKAADIAVELMEKAGAGRSGGGPALRFGAVVYRDQLDGPEAVEYRRLDPDARGLRDWLYQVRPPSGANDPDFEEALFAGLDLALRRVLQGATGMSAVIVIGDAGDNGRSGLSPADLAGRVPAGAFLHAVQVTYPPRSEAQRRANEKFGEHLRTLQGLLAARAEAEWERARIPAALRSRYRASNVLLPVAHSADAAPTGARLHQAIDASRKVVADAHELMGRLMRGEGVAPAEGAEVDYEATSFLISLFIAEYRDPQLVQAMVAEKVQIFRTGYVRLQGKDGRPLMRKVLLLDRRDVGEMLRVLEELTATQGRTLHELIEVWRASVARAVGDEGASMQDLVRRRTGIVFPDRHAVLSKSPREITEADHGAVQGLIDTCNELKNKLHRINNSDQLWFSNFGRQFTWLSEEVLP